MMMPIRMDDPEGSLPDSMGQWRPALRTLMDRCTVRDGVGYLTIDEALIPAGESHRRPGLHVDGVGAWGGGGKYGANGMILASDRFGCQGWNQSFDGEPGPEGDCSHLADQCRNGSELVRMSPDRMYWCSPLAVHESVPQSWSPLPVKRALVRLSMPNDCPWHEGYTENPLGVRPTGEILPARTAFMGYRP
jgi:hypothetical protein